MERTFAIVFIICWMSFTLMVWAATIIAWLYLIWRHAGAILGTIWSWLTIILKLPVQCLMLLLFGLPYVILRPYWCYQEQKRAEEATARISEQLRGSPHRSAPIQIEPIDNEDTEPNIVSARWGTILFITFFLLGAAIGHKAEYDYEAKQAMADMAPRSINSTSCSDSAAELIEPCQFYYSILTNLACY